MLLSREDIRLFELNGFLTIPQLLTLSDLEEVRQLLDPLFDNPERRNKSAFQDLAGFVEGGGEPRSPEICRSIRSEPRLVHTKAFVVCTQVAGELLGHRARYSFDHAIYKAPHNNSATPWHQDHAYTGHRTSLNTVHCWIPLQAATIDNGCMEFVPGSHRVGLLQHSSRTDLIPTRQLIPATEHLTKAVACPLPAGGITVHTPYTMHYSGPNRTGDIRRAWILHFGRFGIWAKFQPVIVAERFFGWLVGGNG
jgi:hypothetical protein